MRSTVKFIAALCAFCILAGFSGFVGANLTIDNGRIEFINTRNSIYLGDGAGEKAYDNGVGSQCHNIGIGEWNLQNNKCDSFGYTEGTRNVCVGNHSCQYNVTGRRNVAVGVAALSVGQHNDSNIAFGYHALTLNGDYINNNIAIGEFAQQHNAGSNRFNIAVGSNSLEYVDGNNNIALGAQTANRFTKGSNNFFLGVAAGRRQLTGSHNVFLGYDSYYGDPNGSYQMNLFGVLTSKDKVKGDLRMRKGAGLELVNNQGDIYRLTVSDDGDLLITSVD